MNKRKLAAYRERMRKLLKVGNEYTVTGYHTGNFVGECTMAGNRLAQFTVTGVKGSCSLLTGNKVDVPYSTSVVFEGVTE